MDAPRNLVVKVKCGDLLRRFTVDISRPQIDFTVDKLKSKINHLFAIDSNINYNLTYTDEDGDQVTFMNDEELHDAIISQRLNPLRINIKLPSDPSPTAKIPILDLSKSVSEGLKSVPDPLRGILSGIAGSVESFSKLGNSPKSPNFIKPNFNETVVSALNAFMEELPKISVGQTSGSESGRSAGQPVKEEIPKTYVGESSGSQPESVLGQTTKDVLVKEEIPKISVSPTSSQPSDDVILRRSYNVQSDPWQAFRECDGAHRTFHRGVKCDGCGMHPIMGPRFKSIVKEDYDLCSRCFSNMGTEAEYTRMDQPLYYPRFHHIRGHGCKSPKVKLDSRFIQDVTVMDGTAMAPLTTFTKIWRMRNNGTVSWPVGTQLLWIGGDRFSDNTSSLLEISETGFPVGCEADIAVDFKAPPRPGRYISYWRMASPVGQKFGQRVWVLIQVEDSRPTTADITASITGPPEPTSEPTNPDTNATLVKIPPPHENLTQPSAPPTLPSAAAPLPPAEDALLGQISQEQALLKELEEMGFRDTEINREVLRANDYDLEKTVDEICGVSEWDPILEELEEMGFCDKVKNMKLLVKNGGSIKRVVLDLIAGEQA